MPDDKECNCKSEDRHFRSEYPCGCDCDCCRDAHHFHRRHSTKSEQIAELEEYLSELKLEIQAIEEKLTDLKK